MPTILNNNSINTMLPEPQERNITIVFIFMAFSLAIVCYTLHKENYTKTLAEIVSLLIVAMTVIVAIEIINRICYFTNELIKINVEHGGSIIRVFQTVTFNIPSGIIVMSSIVLFLVLIYNTKHSPHIFFLLSTSSTLKTEYIVGFFFALVFSFFLADIVNIRECRAQKIENLNRLGGMDYGSSMACSYFYGYLKIILPADGKENDGLIGRIEKYEAENNVTVPVKKLFILIPASFYISPTLETPSNKWLEPTLNKLLFVKIHRAGVRGREYKSTIYKIHPGGLESGKTPIYIVTEGATPMLTFFEVQQQKHRYSDVYTEYKREIGKLFYKTLKQLLNDNPDCRDLCELVYYEDYDEKGKSVNPGEILLRRIQEYSSQL